MRCSLNALAFNLFSSELHLQLESKHPRCAQDLLTPAFASNLENLMDGDRVALWIHGHMHESYDDEIYGTRVVCNPRGYVPRAVNPDFRPDWGIDI